MKTGVAAVIACTMLILAGCSFMRSTTPVPTSTPTAAMFIRVPTPTPSITPTPRFIPTRTENPTLEITQEISATFQVPTATPTATPTAASVIVLPDPSSASWQPVLGGFEFPVGLENADDGTGRMFIVEQRGLIRIIKDGGILPEPFLDLTQKVDCCGERGLLGLVFHPNYIENGYFYVNFTEKVNGQLYTAIARFSVSPNNPDQADPGSEMRILHIEQPYQNHNGGAIQFGPDGYLYIGTGDGGSAGDPHGNGQSLETLLGKILRLDVNINEPYAIPPENPYVSGGGMWEIWAAGLRNPWRITFDRATGDLYLGDVGQDAWEEIDFLPAGSQGGANFGWNFFEGTHPYRGSPPPDASFIQPVAEYEHALGNSVTGGVVYRGMDLLDWQGVYLYGDFGSGRVWGLLHLPDGSWQNALMYETSSSISSFGVDEDGEVYLVDYGGDILILR